MEFVLPSKTYQQSYREYIEELGDEERYPFPLSFEHEDFDALLAKLDDFASGRNIPEGYVPSTTLWLVEGEQLLGVANLRHYLNARIEESGGHIGLGVRPAYRGKGLGKHLMKLAIETLNGMGVNQVHIHCYKDNLPSARAIVANGGKLHSEIMVESKTVQRYLVL